MGGYNPLTKNCQQFAAELFAYLVGDNYKEEVKRVFERYQSPYDKRNWQNIKTNVTETISVYHNQNKSKYSNTKPHPKIVRKNEINSRKRRSIQTDQFLDDSYIDYTSHNLEK